MAYDQPQREEYALGAVTLTAGTTLNIRGPKGKKGLLRDVDTNVTTSINSATVPEVDVGISSGDATYGRFRLGTAAATGYAAGARRASVEAAGGIQNGLNPVTLSDFPNHIELAKAFLPADTNVVVSTTVAATGGAAVIKVIIDWF